MESLNENEVSAGRSRPNAVDRVTIGKAESEKLAAWLKQVQDDSKGFLQLTKADIMNFLIREHKLEFTAKELSQLRANHYDPIKHINWITQELKTALAKDDLMMVAILQEEIKGIELSAVRKITSTFDPEIDASASGVALSGSPKQKRRRAKKPDAAPLAETISIADLQGNLSEG